MLPVHSLDNLDFWDLSVIAVKLEKKVHEVQFDHALDSAYQGVVDTACAAGEGVVVADE